MLLLLYWFVGYLTEFKYINKEYKMGPRTKPWGTPHERWLRMRKILSVQEKGICLISRIKARDVSIKQKAKSQKM